MKNMTLTKENIKAIRKNVYFEKNFKRKVEENAAFITILWILLNKVISYSMNC